MGLNRVESSSVLVRVNWIWVDWSEFILVWLG